MSGCSWAVYKALINHSDIDNDIVIFIVILIVMS